MSGLETASVLARHAAGHAASTVTDPLILSERPCNLAEVAAFRGQSEKVRALLPNTCLHIAPDRWIVSATGTPAADLARSLDGIAAVVDQSSGYLFLRLTGTHVRAVLAKSCRLDLAPEVFPSGTCARTILAQIPVLVSRPDLVATFDLFAPSTLADTFVEHLLGAAAEYGIIIKPTNLD